MPDIVIRRMTEQDTGEVAGIESACFSMPWSLADFEFEMRENPVARYLVAQKQGVIIGFAGAHIILDEGHVINVAVLSGHRSGGVGRALMRALIQYASNLGAGYLTLETRTSNAHAVQLYQSLGFQTVSIRKRYYQDNGEDALLMVCDTLPLPEADFSEPETVTG